MFRTEFQGKELYLLKRVDNRRRGRIPQNRTVFEMRPNKSDVKFEKGRWRRVTIEVTEEKTYDLPRFTTDRINIQRP